MKSTIKLFISLILLYFSFNSVTIGQIFEDNFDSANDWIQVLFTGSGSLISGTFDGEKVGTVYLSGHPGNLYVFKKLENTISEGSILNAKWFYETSGTYPNAENSRGGTICFVTGIPENQANMTDSVIIDIFDARDFPMRQWNIQEFIITEEIPAGSYICIRNSVWPSYFRNHWDYIRIFGNNNLPIASAGTDQEVLCSPTTGIDIYLDGSRSSDPDGDELIYIWTVGDSVIANVLNPKVHFAPGDYVVTLTVNDVYGASSTDDVNIKIVADQSAPKITLLGDNPLNLYRFGETYSDPGVEVVDECDSDPSLTISSSVDIKLPGSYQIIYKATDFNGNTSEVIRTVNVLDDPAYLTNNYLFLADKEIKLDKTRSVTGYIHSNGKINLKKGPITYFSNITSIDKIDVGKDVTIEGDVISGDKIKLVKDVVITGMIKEYAGVDYVDLPELDFTCDGEDVKVEKEESYNLTPDNYEKVEVKEGATLNLTSGLYYIHELDVKKNCQLILDISNGPIEINVEKKFDIDKEVVMTIQPLGIADSRYVVINSMKDIKIDENTIIAGSLIAPYGKVDIKKEVEFYGSISAKEIDIGKEVLLVYHEDNNESILTKNINIEFTEIEESTTLPTNYLLSQNYPNPFNPTTEIKYSIPKDSHVSLRIFDVLGNEIAILEDGYKSAGTHKYHFNASNLTSGIYFYNINASGFVDTKKMLLIK